uniref:Membrane protein n=1 Tax=uncultured organism TaxID=155900 RepID=M1Q183_9ZZZZ|nr:membrane protein [uncultured organism]
MSFIIQIIHILVLLGLVITALAVVYFKDLISAAIALGSSSLLLSLEFYLLRAPDVAIAEAAVGAALTTAIYVFAIKSTERKEEFK